MRSFPRFLKTLPFFSVIFIILGGSPLSIGGYPLLPAFFLIPVYYWLVFRPDWLPLWSLFGIGLFYDALMGGEFGYSSLLLMLSVIVGLYARPFLSSYRFPLIWGAFCLYSFGYLILYGAAMSGGTPLFVSWVYGVLLYPLLSWALSHLNLRLQSYA